MYVPGPMMYVYACMWVSIYTRPSHAQKCVAGQLCCHVRTHKHPYIYTSTHTYTQTPMHLHKHPHIHTSTHTYTQAPTHTHKHPPTHTHTHTHTHTSTHTFTWTRTTHSASGFSTRIEQAIIDECVRLHSATFTAVKDRPSLAERGVS